MRLGFGLPHAGKLAGPDALIAGARRAEELGFDDLWVGDRLLVPLAPRAPYLGAEDGRIPEAMQRMLDPLEALTFAAAHTTSIGLGTSVLNLPFYNPALLARQLTSVDVLSRGRLRVGIGTGWMPEEFEAVGVPMRERDARADEALQVLKAVWSPDPVRFEGKFYRVPESTIGLKPVQKPHPPIYCAAFAPRALRRVGLYADGWLPAGLPIPLMQHLFGGIQETARTAGRDPKAIELVVRANVTLTDNPVSGQRKEFTGHADQIRDDIRAVRDAGAHALHFDVQFARGVDSLDKLLEQMELLWRLAKS